MKTSRPFARAARLYADTRGNVLMLCGFAIIPLVFATGMGIDYAKAAKLQTKLNAIADAAALAAVTQPMMDQKADAAKTVAQNMFNGQATGLAGLVYDPKNLSVTITENSATTLNRTVLVSYTAQSTNSFAGVLGMKTITIGGTASSNAVTAPNIDFYLTLDTSPSMAIAATTDGVNTMVANTSHQGGCAFACHQSYPDGDDLGNPKESGKMIDNYKLARNLGVVLRTDLVTQAAQGLMDTAANAEATNHAVYRMSISTFDSNFNQIQKITPDLAQAKVAAGKATMLTVYKNGWIDASTNDNDTNTSTTAMVNGLSSILPPKGPGNGTNAPGDSPQAWIFLVTDGVRDEQASGRVISQFDNTWCAYAKNAGFNIAIVYTTYLPLPTNGFYNSYVAPFQPSIGDGLKACASPGMFYEVTTNGDISGALNALFQKAIMSAHLVS